MEPPRPEPTPTAAIESSSSPLPSASLLAFAGSSDPDVALAKSFWNSATLQPPLESRLAPRRDSTSTSGSAKGSAKSSKLDAPSGGGLRCAHPDYMRSAPRSSVNDRKEDEKSLETIESEAEESDVKKKYLEKGKKREEIIALLRKQREERIAELVSHPHKPKAKPQESMLKKTPESDLDDQESVKALP
ncbi:cilia- and flagella-associated protein HOATZ isoform X2 [Rhineura floridana]|uniref:cilia- and flagella-associated protein HOATZ isoform X2 n=2 Tax=Rhineura floridana TaxID=261503 RepID=UPI002AC83E19|nr:cilia- and flagella-associated protein HOATZ isoform X2 [Rhineura floridana]